MMAAGVRPRLHSVAGNGNGRAFSVKEQRQCLPPRHLSCRRIHQSRLVWLPRLGGFFCRDGSRVQVVITQPNMRVAATRLGGLVQRRGFASTARRLDTYGFVGLGQMGYQMARNLQAKLKPTDKVAIFDINPQAMKGLETEMKAVGNGATVELAASAFDASKDADTVITVLPEPQHVQGVYKSILTSSLPEKRDRIFVDCSTIDPSTSRQVAASVASAGQGTFVDAPMSGGVVGATAGTLTFMLGADEALVPRVEPTLLRMGRKVLHCGAQGAGLSAKLANNYLLALNNIATAEAMNLGMRWGLDPRTLAGVINVSTGRCWPSEVNNPVRGVVEAAPAGRDYRGGFGISLMKKDLRLAMVAAEEAGARMAMADAAYGVYEAAEKLDECKGRDFSVVYRYLGGKEGE
ncbi:3-hydroxyisobutyrate dehydrogenase [Purpureocillium takamizusanense]|uniref:3-hydroxyisobutyrate dehydrogenase n=1 Tax=Purpureocillium takamizusanense TaxID=2060973 RepID=A0A9Q8V5Y1_9HYPO|nr:3-hydroxyisobutyrate dehydrogenase [Purpureocillium takamizusanense]UNI13247.1 3-hydroxyisobutyrate dehydrogenase [Purpureocillium takamizusanense]